MVRLRERGLAACAGGRAPRGTLMIFGSKPDGAITPGAAIFLLAWTVCVVALVPPAVSAPLGFVRYGSQPCTRSNKVAATAIDAARIQSGRRTCCSIVDVGENRPERPAALLGRWRVARATSESPAA